MARTITEKDTLFSEYSDTYKDVNGFRPRLTIEEYNLLSVQALKEDIDWLDKELKLVLSRERAQEKMNISAFKELLVTTVGYGADNQEVALRWLAEGVDTEFDFDGLMYEHGIMDTEIANEMKCCYFADK
jgi:hypothetical protein